MGRYVYQTAQECWTMLASGGSRLSFGKEDLGGKRGANLIVFLNPLIQFMNWRAFVP